MNQSEWITVTAIFVGPIAAVGITLFIEHRRKKLEAKLLAARLLLTTRDFPSDPNFQIGIKLIPLEFRDSPNVLSSHREFLEASNVSPEGRSEAEITAIAENTRIKLTRLLAEVCQAVGLKIRETDIQTGNFGTRGFVYRDNLLQDSQRAMRDIANILWLQTRLLAGESWDQINPSGERPLTDDASALKGDQK